MIIWQHNKKEMDAKYGSGKFVWPNKPSDGV